jgi:hypothetical protein
MKRTTIVLLMLGLLLSLTLGLSAPSPVSAHTSTYCGHGHNGIITHSHYWRSFWEGSWHFHVYRHYASDPTSVFHAYQHDQQKVCPGH